MSTWRGQMPLLGVALLAFVAARPAYAATNDGATDFSSAVAALEKGNFDDAIDRLELLADQGFVHADASWDRAAAYVQRARSPQARPGDLGRAAAALAEASELRPDDARSEAALEAVRMEIARRRARQGQEPEFARPSLARAVVGLAPEDAWAVLALFGSLGCTLGLLVRARAQRSATTLGGTLAASIGALLLIVTGALTATARQYRTSSSPAVVVVSDARLLDEQGAALPDEPGSHGPPALPEGASVWVLEQRAARARVEWGTRQAWVSTGQLRLLARP